MKHTPEPWEIHSRTHQVFGQGRGEGSYAVPVASIHFITDWPDEYNEAVAIANAERIVAAINFLKDIPTELLVVNLRENLRLFIEDNDRWTESYAEDVFPKWLIVLAGGLDSLNVARKDEFDGES